jgi:hypothetical protein
MPDDAARVTSPTDPRIAGVGRESVAGEDQIGPMLAASPVERLRCLVEMIEFEERAHRARLIPKAL